MCSTRLVLLKLYALLERNREVAISSSLRASYCPKVFIRFLKGSKSELDLDCRTFLTLGTLEEQEG